MVQVGDLFYVLRLLEGEEAPSSQDLIWVSLVFLSPTFDLKKSRTFKRHNKLIYFKKDIFILVRKTKQK